MHYFKGYEDFSKGKVDFKRSGNFAEKLDKRNMEAFFECFDNGEYSLFSQIDAICFAWDRGHNNGLYNSFFEQEIENFIQVDNLWNADSNCRYDQTNIFEVEGINYTIQYSKSAEVITIYKDLDYLSTEEKIEDLKANKKKEEPTPIHMFHLKEDVERSWWYGREISFRAASYHKADDFFNKNKIILQYPREYSHFLKLVNSNFSEAANPKIRITNNDNLDKLFFSFINIFKLKKIDIENLIMVSRQIAFRRFLISDLNYKEKKKVNESRIKRNFDLSDFD